MADENAIEISNLHKRYGTLRVLRGIDLTVATGEAFALLGPNGAGKSTLIQTMLGLLVPDEGTVRILGSSRREFLSPRVGYLPERPRYHTQFTAREYLAMLGQLSDLSGAHLHQRVEAVLELVGINDVADRRIGTYSKGMLQRLGLAQALLHEPDLLIVDEPGSGLDPAGQRDMAELLQRVREAGHTIFLCTHQLNEVGQLCDRVGVLAKGRLDQVVRLDELQAQGHSVTIRVRDLPAETANFLTTLSPNIRCTRTEVVLFPVSDALQAQVLRTLLDDAIAVIALIPEANALEQFYLRAIDGTDGSTSHGVDPGEHADTLLEALMHGDKG
jgi:ABC-2 type transport system ATP-binding protein